MPPAVAARARRSRARPGIRTTPGSRPSASRPPPKRAPETREGPRGPSLSRYRTALAKQAASRASPQPLQNVLGNALALQLTAVPPFGVYCGAAQLPPNAPPSVTVVAPEIAAY